MFYNLCEFGFLTGCEPVALIGGVACHVFNDFGRLLISLVVESFFRCEEKTFCVLEAVDHSISFFVTVGWQLAVLE